MSHCVACDRMLTNKEAARKHRKTGEEIGLCNHCFESVLSIQPIPLAEGYEEGLEEVEALDSLLDDYNDLARMQDYLDAMDGDD